MLVFFIAIHFYFFLLQRKYCFNSLYNLRIYSKCRAHSQPINVTRIVIQVTQHTMHYEAESIDYTAD